MSLFGMAKRSALAGLVLAVMSVAGCSSSNSATAAKSESRTYSFWPSAPDEPKVQFLTSFNSSRSIAPQASRFEKMVYGENPALEHVIMKPYGVRLRNGKLYICDVRDKGVTILDLPKQQTRIMGAAGTMAVTRGVDIAIADDGMMYVVDAQQSAIVVFTPDERPVGIYKLPNCSPVSASVHGDRLYVADFKNALIRVHNRQTGELIQTIGERGGEDGQFIGPLGVTTDASGNVYVSDTVKARIQKFSPEGKLLLAFGATGNRPGDFVRPKHIDVQPDGHIHVVDAAFNNVQVFDPEGRIVGFYGSPGTHPGAMDLPAGISISQTDAPLFSKYVHPAFQVNQVVVVTNQFSDQKVSIYAVGQLKSGKTVADVANARAKVGTGLATPTTSPTTRPSGI